ncbi:hypothetical protein BGZ60DRAFT_527700 [Tricladium varicosporioides]|nr:hypothetical protein BGZ60DRAFT_527700 [Hymenoscyphus varicosporioides]
MVLESGSEKLPGLAISSQNASSSPSSSPRINPEATGATSSEPIEKITSRGTGSVSWAPIQWPYRDGTNGKPIASTSEPETHIYWRSPASMVAAFVVGILMAVGHHLYYSSLDSDIVGNPDEQQGKLRYGNFFAFATQFTLASSVGFAYTQWLWRTLRKRTITVSCLDSAFSADTVLMSMFNPEMWWKLKLASLLALLVWCLQIPSLFTPATLGVVPGLNEIDALMEVPLLKISTNDTDQHVRFEYSAPLLPNTVFNGNDTSKFFVGPRTILTRLIAAVAATGRILPIAPPSLNSTYSLQFFGPTVKCQEANTTEAMIIDHLQKLKMSIRMGNYTQTAMSYFALVPNDAILNGADVTDSSVAEDISDIRMQRPVNGSNQLWAMYQRYAWNSTGDMNTETHYMVCRLYNASYDVNLTFESGTQLIKSEGVKLLNEISYPKDDIYTVTNYASHSYSAFMWALTDQLVGSLGWWVDNSTNRKFSEIATPIEHNSLLGSVDLDPFFDFNNALYLSNSTGLFNKPLSDQRLEDKGLARNRTLAVLIEELAFNSTVSLMSSHLLSPNSTTTVHQTVSVNRYSYNPRSLLLAYGLAIGATLLANSIGVYAYIENGAAHDKKFSSVLGATREAELGELFCHKTQGKLPVPKDTKTTLLKYRKMDDGGWSFRSSSRETRRDHKRRRRSLMTRRKSSV